MHLLKHILGWPWAFSRCNLPWTKRYAFQSSLIPPIWVAFHDPPEQLCPQTGNHGRNGMFTYSSIHTRFWYQYGKLEGKYQTWSYGFYGFGHKGLHLVVKKTNKYCMFFNQIFVKTSNLPEMFRGNMLTTYPCRITDKVTYPNLGNKRENHHRLKRNQSAKPWSHPYVRSENSGLVPSVTGLRFRKWIF